MRLEAVRKWRMNRREKGFVDSMEGEREGNGSIVPLTGQVEWWGLVAGGSLEKSGDGDEG